MLKEISSILSKINELDLVIFAQTLSKAKILNRIWVAGNGGSSSTASHFVSDLTNLGFNATCLTDNVPCLTAYTNDYGWNEVFQRQLQHMKKDDILVTISVHGGTDNWSNNLILATIFANSMGAKTLSLIGHDGGELAKHSDFSIIVPSDNTYIIEGIHSILTHVICQKIKERQ